MSDPVTFQYFANNQWHDPHKGQWFDSENPADGKVWARVPDCGEADIDRAVSAAKAAFYQGPWGTLLPAQRGRVLRRIGEVITANAERLGAVELRDNGRTSNIAPGLSEGGWQVDSWHYYAGLCDKFEGSLIPAEMPNMHNYMTWEPFGVVALFLPWNAPIGTLIWKLAAALAAGNTAVIKPSEHASCSVLELMDILNQADVLPPGVLNVVTGFGATTGAPLVRHPDVRMISFTGGTSGGRAVAALAAEQVKPVIMELGGKSPQIVRADADLDLAAKGIASAIFPGGGQSCISGSRLLIHASVIDAFTAGLVDIASKAVVGPPSDPRSTIGPLANRPHYESVIVKIDAAVAVGHALVLDGRTAKRDEGYFVGPTIFANVPNTASLAQTEVFGPVASTEAWTDDDDVIQKANDTPYGLAAGIWTADVALGMRMANRIEAGTVYINNYFNAATQSPVGGFKQSGYGRENGIEGMRCFMQTKSVWLATLPSQSHPFE